MKCCSKCGDKKPLSEFHLNAARKDGAQAFCKKCSHTAGTDWRRRKCTGISPDEYEKLRLLQQGRCAICSRFPEEVGKHSLSVDHCHESGTIRGLLCRSCNVLLGHAKDRPTVLRAAAEYLERFEIHE